VAADDEGTVSPDRPDVTDSTHTVPPGAVQIETGIQYTRARQAGRPAQQFLDFPGTLRIGLSDRIEARLPVDPVVQLREASDAGHGTVGFGLKYRFLDADSPWPSLGVEPVVLFHIDAGSARPDVGARGLASWELPAGFTLDVNAGMTAMAQSDPSGYLLQAQTSASLGKQISERLSGFAELFFSSKGERDGREQLGFDTGLTYLVTRWLAVDASVTTTLTGRGPDVAVQAGISVLFGR
jgi:hypothetical protein